jgi:hypothetical protein
MNLAAVDAAEFTAGAAILEIDGVMEFSSQEGLLTIAGVVDALAAGFDATANYMSYPSQVFFPTPLFQTQEGPNPPLLNPAGRTDAFAITRCFRDTDRDGLGDVWAPPWMPPPGSTCNAVFQSAGTRVTSAWQFVAAHGIARRVKVAIIDGGFWLNPDGTRRGPDTDFPLGPGPNGRLIQYDFSGEDANADGPNPNNCTAGAPCAWHGTACASVALGVVNNQAGAAGTGGMVADPILLKVDGSFMQRNEALRAAVAWGADVVSMSFSGKRDSVARRENERSDTPIKDAVARGSKTVFVANAGNGDGNTGYDVGAPNFEHPCIGDHVICVGALNDDATSKQGYSNFGAAVDIFAPTNIPVMAQPACGDPNPNGPAGLQAFSGTSASAPFVAGVAAMMKAINPDLNSDQVSNILRDTANRNGVAPVTHHIDAFAAVLRAAEGIEGTKDHLDAARPNGNDLIEDPTVLNGPPDWNIRNLSLHRPQDRDYFRFNAPAYSSLAIELQHPQALGPLSLFNFDGLQGSCGAPLLLSDTTVGNFRFITYGGLPGGTYVLGVGGGAVNAYHLRMTLDPRTLLDEDDYEPNDTPDTAWPLSLFQGAGSIYVVRADRVHLSATVHDAADVDHYLVRGVRVTLADRVFLSNAHAAVQVQGNESPVTLEVFKAGNALASDGPCALFQFPDSPNCAELVGQASSPSCREDPASVAVTEGERILVRVSGGVGHYELANRIDGDARSLPYLVRDRVYEVLHPGEPVEDGIPFPQFKVFVADAAFSEIRLSGRDLHLNLFDFDGNLMAEGQPCGGLGCDEILDLAGTRPGDIYTLQITPLIADPEGLPLRLDWQPAPSVQISGNLITNPGAEDGVAEEGDLTVEEIPGWYVPANPPGAANLPMPSMPTVRFYDEAGVLAPTFTAPGPDQRGNKLFVGGPYSSPSAIQQFVTVDPDWYPAIDAGRVRFSMSAFLGGLLDQGDYAEVNLEFRTGGFELLGAVTLPSISPVERQGQTGLWPVSGGDVVPAGTNIILVNLVFVKTQGDYTDAYADNFELTLSEY